MANFRNFNLGPYIECKNKKAAFSKIIRSCPNKECETHGEVVYSHNFCFNCGSKITSVEIDVSEPMLDVHQILDEIKDVFTILYRDEEKQIDVLGPNIDGYSYDLDEDMAYDGSSFEITLAEIQIRMSKFKQNFSKEIEKVESFYGKDNVSSKFGIVAFIN